MRVCDIIRKKRDGQELSETELSFVISGYCAGSVPDYQVSALLMAIVFRGMTEKEIFALTGTMLNSGKILDLTDMRGPRIDKHSTGGVGDKTSIILAPLLAAAGVIVPMIAGRGLGHTGGTLDKLDAIPGFRTALSTEEFRTNLRNVGSSIMGQTEEIAPADKKLYSLRDVTATIDSIPLIASSIMSKKLAEGIDGLVLDVKVGSGAFMKKIEDARLLANTMVGIGNSMGVKTVAVLTDMDQPLGRTIGNGLEIKECISALQGKWSDDLRDVTLALGAWMVELAATSTGFSLHYMGKDFKGIEEYSIVLNSLLEDGSAFRKFVGMVEAQGGNPEVAFRPGLVATATGMKQITTPKEGYITKMDAEKAGIAAMVLGAGREKMTDAIDYSAGIILNRKVGDYVRPGEQIAMFYYNDEKHLKEAEDIFLSGVDTGPEKIKPKSVVLEVIR
ncbi:MAG TPA: thymidine phosphorylase [Thermodesulfovibrionales bacterium]|nr:thymidine phosphorylase [Thermodesulfovibrionales bacterium]